jgi:hypothetical protein
LHSILIKQIHTKIHNWKLNSIINFELKLQPKSRKGNCMKINWTNSILTIQIAKEEIFIKQKLNTISAYENKQTN